MSSRRTSIGVMVLAVAVLLSFPTPAAAAEYPSWDDIQSARGNEKATQAAIDQIGSLLNGLRDEAGRLGDEAVVRGAEAEQARADLALATSRATGLQQRVRIAEELAEESAAQAGQIIAQLYRSGGMNTVSVLLFPGSTDTDGLLYRLGALGKLGEQTERRMTTATIDANAVSSLRDQAAIARAARDAIATEAESALTRATEAERRAEEKVAEQEARSQILFEQLALLRNTTAQLERDYSAGKQAEKDFADQAAGAEDAAGSGGEGGFTVPSNSVNDPAGARAIAAQMVADRGWGEDQYSCLVLLWNRESGWRTNAYNPGSGAYGIPQSLPGHKMANIAADWRTNPATQITWGLAYITSRYAAPCGAWAHSQSLGWY